MAVSGLTGDGLGSLWSQIELHNTKLTATGELAERRQTQQVQWMWSMVDDRLRQALRTAPATLDLTSETVALVGAGELPATVGADRLIASFLTSEQ